MWVKEFALRSMRFAGWHAAAILLLLSIGLRADQADIEAIKAFLRSPPCLAHYLYEVDVHNEASGQPGHYFARGRWNDETAHWTEVFRSTTPFGPRTDTVLPKLAVGRHIPARKDRREPIAASAALSRL